MNNEHLRMPIDLGQKFEGSLELAPETGKSLPSGIAWDMDGTLLKPGLSSTLPASWEGAAASILNVVSGAYEACRMLKRIAVPNYFVSDSTKRAILSYISKKREDLESALELIAEQYVSQAVVSNNTRQGIGRRILEYYELEPHFSSSIFREDMDGLHKPHKQAMALVISDLELEDTGTLWVVGDRATDMRFAIENKKHFSQKIIPVAMGYSSEAAQYLHRYHLDKGMIFDTPLELARFIKQLSPNHEPKLETCAHAPNNLEND